VIPLISCCVDKHLSTYKSYQISSLPMSCGCFGVEAVGVDGVENLNATSKHSFLMI